MTFEQWKDEYGLVHEPNYSAYTEADCLAAWNAGRKELEAQLAERDKLLLMAKDALSGIAHDEEGYCLDPDVAEALAAINDSKVVEGLIVCDARPVAEINDKRPSSIYWHSHERNCENGTLLYAQRKQ